MTVTGIPGDRPAADGRAGSGTGSSSSFCRSADRGSLFAVGFPPAAPDRLPVLVIAVALALAAAWSPARAIVAFAFLFPCAGLLARLSGGTDPVAWPVLLFGGLAAGWTFRFLYDFDSMPEPSPLDRPLRALLLLWTLATVLAVARASTLWAALHGLTGRAVNGEGLPEKAAIRESLLAFAALAAGAGFFFLLRRQGPAVRLKALRAALLGVGASAAAACLQRLGLLPPETRPYWKMTGTNRGRGGRPQFARTPVRSGSGARRGRIASRDAA